MIHIHFGYDLSLWQLGFGFDLSDLTAGFALGPLYLEIHFGEELF